jgi:hypothetical protein
LLPFPHDQTCSVNFFMTTAWSLRANYNFFQEESYKLELNEISFSEFQFLTIINTQ